MEKSILQNQESISDTLNYLPGEFNESKKHVALFWDAVNHYQNLGMSQFNISQFCLKDRVTKVIFIKIPEFQTHYAKYCELLHIIPLEKNHLIQILTSELASAKFRPYYKSGFGFCYIVKYKVKENRNIQFIAGYKAVL